MLDLDKHLALHSAALRVSAQRSEVLARNLANADTPNYKATDIDFKKALEHVLDGGGPNALRTTQARHISGAGLHGANDNLPLQTVDRAPLVPSLDNNTVDVAMEQAEFAKNAIRYQASLQFLSSQMRGLMTAITGQ